MKHAKNDDMDVLGMHCIQKSCTRTQEIVNLLSKLQVDMRKLLLEGTLVSQYAKIRRCLIGSCMSSTSGHKRL